MGRAAGRWPGRASSRSAQFRFNLRPITLLAFGCVVFTTCPVAAVAHWLIGLPLAVGFLPGVIVALPDVEPASLLGRVHEEPEITMRALLEHPRLPIGPWSLRCPSIETVTTTSPPRPADTECRRDRPAGLACTNRPNDTLTQIEKVRSCHAC